MANKVRAESLIMEAILKAVFWVPSGNQHPRIDTRSTNVMIEGDILLIDEHVLLIGTITDQHRRDDFLVSSIAGLAGRNM